MKYTQPSDQELRDGQSALRWLVLATIFLIIAIISQVVWFVMLITDNPDTLKAFVIFVGSWILQTYCKWCSDDVKPDNWKEWR